MNNMENLSSGFEESERECKRVFAERIPIVCSFSTLRRLTHHAKWQPQNLKVSLNFLH